MLLFRIKKQLPFPHLPQKFRLLMLPTFLRRKSLKSNSDTTLTEPAEAEAKESSKQRRALNRRNRLLKQNPQKLRRRPRSLEVPSLKEIQKPAHEISFKAESSIPAEPVKEEPKQAAEVKQEPVKAPAALTPVVATVPVQSSHSGKTAEEKPAAKPAKKSWSICRTKT